METGASKALLYCAYSDDVARDDADDLFLGIVIGTKDIRACLKITETNKIVGAWKMPLLHSALHELHQHFQSTGVELSVVEVLFSTPFWTLLPKGIFQEEAAPAYLRFNHSPPEEWSTGSELVLGLDAVNIYAYNPEWRDLAINFFPRSQFSHQHSNYLSAILQWAGQNPGELVFLHSETDHAQITVFRNGSVILTNSFSCQSEEDILFFLLYAMRQLQLDSRKTEVRTSGISLSHASTQLLEKYAGAVRSISELAVNDNAVPDSVIAEYFDAANLMLCV